MHKYTVISPTPPSKMPEDPSHSLQDGEKTAASIHPATKREAQYKSTLSQVPAMV